MSELWQLTAREAVELLRRREVTALELVDAAQLRIAAVEPAVNALPTLCFERAREQARRLSDRECQANAALSCLCGLPVAVKDLNAVAGVRWTEGSRVFENRIAGYSDLMVRTLEANGAIVIAKSNTPEFGAGGTTVNDVFGHTLNPWEMGCTCGGSSGGSAVALATGEVWLATGNDLGGSLRIPASFCSVVGLRPTPGRVAHGPEKLPFGVLNVDGPMARNVGDVALMLDAMCGQHPEDPLSLAPPATPFSEAVDRPIGPKRVAWSADLGITPVDREVRSICARAVRTFEKLGAIVEEAHPDLSEADVAFDVLRALQRAGNTTELVECHREKMSREVVFYAEKALKLSACDVVRAELARGRLFRRMAEFFRRYDLLVTPAVIVPPFDYRERHVMAVGGVSFEDYFSWLRLTYSITVTSCPAMSLPCGFTASGLPVGIQMIAPSRGEARMLAAAALFEAEHGFAAMLPIEPRMRSTMQAGD